MLVEQAKAFFSGLEAVWPILPLFLLLPNLLVLTLGGLGGPIVAGLIIKNWEVIAQMPLFVLLPVIVVVGIGAVAGTRAYYNRTEGKEKK